MANAEQSPLGRQIVFRNHVLKVCFVSLGESGEQKGKYDIVLPCRRVPAASPSAIPPVFVKFFLYEQYLVDYLR